jgi:hypothetical protein
VIGCKHTYTLCIIVLQTWQQCAALILHPVEDITFNNNDDDDDGDDVLVIDV